MLMTAFGFKSFSNTNLSFLGLTIFGFDLFCETLGEPIRPVGEPDRSVAVQPVLLPLFCCPPNVEVLELVSVYLLGEFGSTISA